MTKKQRERQSAQQLGEMTGDTLAQAQTKAALPVLRKVQTVYPRANLTSSPA